MPSLEECVQVALELSYGLSYDAINKLMAPGLRNSSLEHQQKLREMLMLGPRTDGPSCRFPRTL